MGLIQRAALWLAKRTGAVRVRERMYSNARPSRDANFAARTTSADLEVRSSLTNLRGHSRALSRDSSYGKRARAIVVNNVIGAGMGLQGQIKSARKRLMAKPNGDLEQLWNEWARPVTCHTGGELHFSDFERQLVGQVFEAGEVFVRLHYRAFGGGRVPFALELIESERCPHENAPPAYPGPGTRLRLGIEQDDYGRPVRYWFRRRHPGDIAADMGDVSSNELEGVPASNVIHLRIIDRWPQTRGVPWMHTAIQKLNDLEGYSEAEIVAARGAANYLGVIEQGDLLGDTTIEEEADGSYVQYLEPGTLRRLKKGEKITFNSPNRPNAALDPFMRYMLREIAAGVGISYESLSRDYSQSNYSSSRLSLLDDRDTWRVLQLWYIRAFRERVHREFVTQAVFSGLLPSVSVEALAKDPEKFFAAKFKARGWGWVDPTKEVAAYKEAVRSGFTTQTAVIAQTANGADLEDVLEERRQELDQAEQLGLKFDTETEAASAQSADPDPPDTPPPSGDDDDDDDDDDEQRNTPRGLRAI